MKKNIILKKEILMTKYCKGCGIALQNKDDTALGYVPKLESDYCQRCYKLRHYGEVTVDMKQGIDSEETFKKINQLEGIVFWIVDIFAFEASLIANLNRKLPDKHIVLVLTKRDILPSSVSDEKIFEFVQARLHAEKIHVEGILMVGGFLDSGKEAKDSIENIRDIINQFDQNIIFMGVANAGKSTVINSLLEDETLTTSRNPGTTLDIISIPQDHTVWYDTPGIENYHSVLTYLNKKDLKTVIPVKTILPLVFQIYENQSFAVGGLARVDVVTDGKASVVGNFSRSLSIHRGKLENADALWNDHLNEMLVPALDTSMLTMHTYQSPKMDGKMDVVIHGLGWFCISGAVKSITVKVHKGIHVTFRKAMI